MDKELLNYYIKRKGYKSDDLGKVLGVKRPSVSLRMNGKIQFNREEIIAIAKWLELTDQQVLDVFFCDMKVN